MTNLPLRIRLLIMAAVVLVLGGVAIGYAATSQWKASAGSQPTAAAAPAGLLVLPITTQIPSEVADGVVTPMGTQRCDRVYAAADTVACLTPVGSLTPSHLLVLDRSMAVRRSIDLPGKPNRARVSASGRMVAWTMFTSSDSYNAATFSTRTGILDTRTGTTVPSLEEFTVTVDGKPYQAADVNFWGVTFAADDNRFYATMSTAGHRYLIEGDFAARTAHTVTDNVECPSLSPDGTRIAFKRAVDGDPTHGWRLSVLDPATEQITPTAETASIDDQAAWLNNNAVAYANQAADGFMGVWSVPADGTGAPTLIAPKSYSPGQWS